MTYLLDTETVINTIKGVEPAASFTASMIDYGIFISVITYGEVMEGLLHPQRGSHAQTQRFNSFVDAVDVLVVDLEKCGISQVSVWRCVCRASSSLTTTSGSLPPPSRTIYTLYLATSTLQGSMDSSCTR